MQEALFPGMRGMQGGTTSCLSSLLCMSVPSGAWLCVGGEPGCPSLQSQLLLVPPRETKGQVLWSRHPQHLGGPAGGWERPSRKLVQREEGSLSVCKRELAQAAGAAARHRARKARASSPSAGLPEATGVPRAWEGTCFSGAAISASTFFFFLTTHFTVSRKEGHCLSGSLDSKQMLTPCSSTPTHPTASGWCHSTKLRQPGRRAGWAGMACTWLSSHPGPPESLGDPCQSLWATSQTCGELFCAGYTWAPRPEHSQYPSGCCTSIGHLGHCRWPWQAGGSPPSLTWPHRDTSASASAVF